ncbi:MAG: hypothetical protein WCO84_09120, partial [bacterium]
MAEFKRIVKDAKTLADQGKLQVNNIDVYLIRKSIEAAVLLTVTPYFDDYGFFDWKAQQANLQELKKKLIGFREGSLIQTINTLRAQLKALNGRKAPQVEIKPVADLLKEHEDGMKAALLLLMPNMGGIFFDLLLNNENLLSKTILIIDLLRDIDSKSTIAADDILEAARTQLDPNDTIWNEFVNALSEPIGGQSLMHTLSTYEGFITKSSRLVNGVVVREMGNAQMGVTIRMKRELIFRDIVNHFVETQFKSVVGAVGESADGRWIKYRRVGGWVKMPLAEYTIMRMAQQNLTMNRPPFISRLVKDLLDKRANWKTAQELDKFWRIVEQTVYNNMVGAKNRKVQQRKFFVPDDMDRLFKEGIDLRRDLHLTMAQVRQILLDVKTRHVPYLKADALSRKAGNVEDAVRQLETGFDTAIGLLSNDEPADDTTFYTRLNDAISVLTGLGPNVMGALTLASDASKKVYVLGGGPWAATDKCYTPETVFMQELLDRTVMSQKKLDINQTKLPLTNYPMRLLESFKIRVLQDKRFWMVPGKWSWPKALWAIFVDPDFFKQSAAA